MHVDVGRGLIRCRKIGVIRLNGGNMEDFHSCTIALETKRCNKGGFYIKKIFIKRERDTETQ